MTEEEWLACTEPRPMLELLRDKTSERRLRLFVIVCCREIWGTVQNEEDRPALALLEHLALTGPLSNKQKPQLVRVMAGQVVIDCSASDDGVGCWVLDLILGKK
jgi:hypothetical protein